MVNKLAIDWDESELRLVAAQCNGPKVTVTDAAVIPLVNNNVIETLRLAIKQRGLEKTITLVAIGRGKAELRELRLPPVPDEELPEMVRFQAIRTFASAGDSATVDYLVTKRTGDGIEMIVAAVGPSGLTEVRQTCQAADLEVKRISLRPLASAALYFSQCHDVGLSHVSSQGDILLIDLLANDAEIIVARNDRVIFVRTVRMPAKEQKLGKALAGELRRSLAACGSRESLDRVVLWGRESVHAEEQQMLAQASGSEVQVINPFDLVKLRPEAQSALPEHVGRLAPLIGLLVADEVAGDRLIDFLNPRKRPEQTPNPVRKIAIIGVPVFAAAIIGWMMYRQLSNLDRQIQQLRSANATRTADVEKANASIERTETIDSYLDGNVNWLSEVERLAIAMPPSDRMIVRSLAGAVDDRRGGGALTVVGGVTEPEVIDEFENALRDDSHRVTGDGASDRKSDDGYRLGFTETISMDPSTIRRTRYQALDSLFHQSPQESPPLDQTSQADPVPTASPAGGDSQDSPGGRISETDSEVSR